MAGSWRRRPGASRALRAAAQAAADPAGRRTARSPAGLARAAGRLARCAGTLNLRVAGRSVARTFCLLPLNLAAFHFLLPPVDFPMDQPAAHLLPDVADDAAFAARTLDWVGMERIALPLRLADGQGGAIQVPAWADVAANLDKPEG